MNKIIVLVVLLEILADGLAHNGWSTKPYLRKIINLIQFFIQ
jgi:hypothetical protein